MFITNIKRGAESFEDYRGKILYAELRNNQDKIVCSATVDYILRDYYHKKDDVVNYYDVLKIFLDFYGELITSV